MFPDKGKGPGPLYTLHSSVKRLASAQDGLGLIFLHKIAVIRVTTFSHADFNDIFQAEFAKAYPNAVFGSILLADIDLSNASVRKFVTGAFRKIGFHTSTVFPGYYLFYDSSLIAYHPGTFDWDQDATAAGLSSALGGLAAIFFKDDRIFTRTVDGSFKRGPARRLCAWFSDAIAKEERRRASVDWQRAAEWFKSTIDHEFHNALKTFGLPEDATAEVVEDRYLELAREHHPDRADQSDAEAIERATAFMVAINNAREILREELG